MCDYVNLAGHPMPPPSTHTPSNAVQIVDPGISNKQPVSTPKRNPEPPQQRQCRNVLIYGSCKYEGKGCTFQHPPKQIVAPLADEEVQELPRVASPVFVPQVNAPEFVPRTASQALNITPIAAGNVAKSEDAPSSVNIPPESVNEDPSIGLNFQSQVPGELDTFYHGAQSNNHYPLDYHLYTKAAVPYPDTSGHHHGFFISDDIRQLLLQRSDNIWAPSNPPLISPEEVHHYHSLTPLETLSPDRKKLLGHWMTSCYRATSAVDGNVYGLRRIENFRLAHDSALSLIEPWRQISHPNIVRVREAFTTRAFNDSSLVMVYDYHPLAVTLSDIFFKSRSPLNRGNRPNSEENIEEETMWSFIIQIANAMKNVHDRNLALRTIDATKILVTGKNRLRINCCGLIDLISPDGHDISTHQQEDMVAFGRLILSLCSKVANPTNYAKGFEFVARTYSADLKNVIQFLMSPNPHKIIGQIFDFIGSRLLLEMDATQLRADSLESQLSSELENGRLVRLLSKFGFINERPEFARDFRWSETGDKYIIKLFRDHVFHTVDESGKPVISMAHVLSNLNKLDSGSEEKLMLVSRDEQSCLVVSYREVKRCIESAFRELLSSS
ncbi:hypothetical protein CPB86DRAFT_872085 [Serendipita vermifera]|nr:hypothetical protein CPB86DRAFT_872085 [Serendipita vermifera]